MQYDPERPLIGPGPRPWWKIPLLVFLAVATLIGGDAAWIRYRPALMAWVQARRAADAASSALAVNTPTPPLFAVPPPQSGHIFQEMAQINQTYIAWADRQIAKQVPEIPATGPNAGTLTPAILNSPAVMAKWGGPPVPVSLAAAGVHLPPGTPADGSIVGMTPQRLRTMVRHAHIPGLTVRLLREAITTASRYFIVWNGNDPVGSIHYLNAYAMHAALDQNALDNEGNPLIDVFTRSPSQGGMLLSREVAYRQWVSLTGIPSWRRFLGSTTESPVHPATENPAGHVVLAGIKIVGLTDHLIGSGLVRGRLTIGQYVTAPATCTLALIQDGGVRRWYVTAFQIGPSSVLPQTVYWTAP